MTGALGLSNNGRTLTVRLPLALRRRGGRKLVVTPLDQVFPRARIDNTMVKAVARGFRWKRLLESGRYASVLDLAQDEGINQSYLCRVLRLTLLAPDMIEAILDGRQPAGLQLDSLLSPLPAEWTVQRRNLVFSP
jgi:hypothetical protein